MFYTHGTESILKNIKLLTLMDKKVDSYDMKYRNVLLSYHKGKIPINYSDDIFIYSNIISNELAKAYNEGISLIDDKHQGALVPSTEVPIEDLEFIYGKCQISINLLKQFDLSLYNIFKFLIHSVFSKKSNKVDGLICNAASSSNAIGVIFLNCSDKLSIEDILELLIHEFTHASVFIDEICNQQFYYSELVKPENYSRSAILNSNRPLDKVVHSIIVAAQILHFRNLFNNSYDVGMVSVHPDSYTLMAKTIESIDNLLSSHFVGNVLTEHAIDLVNVTRKSLESIYC